jgi:hypothetical protein
VRGASQASRVFYHKPALTASFLLDPVNFRMSEAGIVDLPFENLTKEEENEAISDMSRPAGSQADAVVAELGLLKFTGFSDMIISLSARVLLTSRCCASACL